MAAPSQKTNKRPLRSSSRSLNRPVWCRFPFLEGWSSTPEQYPRERAVRLVAEHRGDYGSEYATIGSIAAKVGIASAETLRQRVRQAEVNSGQWPGVSSEEPAEIRRLKRENAELRRANFTDVATRAPRSTY
jgi:transposase